MQIRAISWLAGALILLSNCASAPPPPSQRTPVTLPSPPVSKPVEVVPDKPETPSAFVVLDNWPSAQLGPGVAAFERSCQDLQQRSDSEYLSTATPWAGQVADWRGLCESLPLAGDTATARKIIEALTLPVEIVASVGTPRFTGYFEPLIEARRYPVGRFTAPVPGPPSDLEQSSSGPRQRLPNGQSRPYPPRSTIRPEIDRVLGYAHPADVFFLQIQGSGRLQFDDGSTVRAAYYAHNGHPFRSTANWLLSRGEITPGEASMSGIRAWMDRVGAARAQEAMNANPRYVFFQALPQGDPNLGPKGAMGIPLTPFGSMAVDLDLHAMGVPYLVTTNAPGLGGDWTGLLVAQDTGGAITGSVRGDIYFGTGAQAGAQAGTMNAPGRMWAILPRAVAQRLTSDDQIPVAEQARTLRPRAR